MSHKKAQKGEKNGVVYLVHHFCNARNDEVDDAIFLAPEGSDPFASSFVANFPFRVWY